MLPSCRQLDARLQARALTLLPVQGPAGELPGPEDVHPGGRRSRPLWPPRCRPQTEGEGSTVRFKLLLQAGLQIMCSCPTPACRRLSTAVEASLANAASWWETLAASNVQSISTPQELRAAVLTGGPVLVDFFSSWCSACRRLHPKLMQLATQNPGVTFLKVRQHLCTGLLPCWLHSRVQA